MSDNLINLITFTDQSFLALMALVGATMVFKLQLIDKQIDSKWGQVEFGRNLGIKKKGRDILAAQWIMLSTKRRTAVACGSGSIMVKPSPAVLSI